MIYHRFIRLMLSRDKNQKSSFFHLSARRRLTKKTAKILKMTSIIPAMSSEKNWVSCHAEEGSTLQLQGPSPCSLSLEIRKFWALLVIGSHSFNTAKVKDVSNRTVFRLRSLLVQYLKKIEPWIDVLVIILSLFLWES